MAILIKKATVYDDRTEFHLKCVDILIDDGIIQKIGSNISYKGALEVQSDELCVSPGWLDVGCFNGEPGFEQREDLESLKNSAAHGGYAFLAALPNTSPVIDNKSQVNFLQKRNSDKVTEIIPLATATKGARGKELAEYIDLTQAGVVAFTDGHFSSVSKSQLLRILEYTKGIETRYIHFLSPNTISLNGQINEGAMSINLGLEGIPKVEEYINVQEAIQIAEYVDEPLNIQNISTGQSLKDCMNSSTEIKVSVAYLNLIFDDSRLESFDSNFKVYPPLRDSTEQKELIKAINKGQINCISSNHVPILQENKDKEFGLAEFGAIGLETCFSALNTFCNSLKLERLIYCLSTGSYEYLDLVSPEIKIGQKAILTLFDPSPKSIYDKSSIKSKSDNSPLIGKTLQGCAIGIINGEKYLLNNDL